MRVNFVCLAILLIASSFAEYPDRDVRAKEVNLMIRQIGHRLLLQAGDSTSIVLPVTEVKEGTFQLRFENEFFFSHDSLLSLSETLLPKTEFPSGYTLTVHECLKSNIAYGFQRNNKSLDIVACQHRLQPWGCYTLELVFPDLYQKAALKGKVTQSFSTITLAVSGMLVLLGVTLIIGRLGKIRKGQPVTELPSLGKFLFNAKDQRLLLGGEVITLTAKECSILELLNKDFGKLIPRETLMEKIWINEGVITGRSLDMFVSKLRKKLNGDPGLRITNIHGKGYKLEIINL